MARIELRNITKKFGKVTALKDVNLVIEDKEFLVLFGPAGAGKTTILKTVAGLEFPNVGNVYINNEDYNLVEPAKRNVSMVFENYALYPHLTVFENIASPMKSPLYKKDEETIKQEVHRVAAMLKIDNLLDRLPSQVSNGQRQRTALGRCLVRDPNVFLMDEPIAHLDAKLRHFMRAELKEMQAAFDTTTIYVTHDYLEAMSLGDRIAVINEGEIIQVGTPDEIYSTPANEFVARLMGEPEIDIFDVVMEDDGKTMTVSMFGSDKKYELKQDIAEKIRRRDCEQLHMGIRGGDIVYSFTQLDEDYIETTVYSVEPIGNKTILVVQVEDTLLNIVATNDFVAELDSKIYIKLNIDKALFFDADKNYIYRHDQEKILEV